MACRHAVRSSRQLEPSPPSPRPGSGQTLSLQHHKQASLPRKERQTEYTFLNFNQRLSSIDSARSCIRADETKRHSVRAARRRYSRPELYRDSWMSLSQHFAQAASRCAAAVCACSRAARLVWGATTPQGLAPSAYRIHCPGSDGTVGAEQRRIV